MPFLAKECLEEAFEGWLRHYGLVWPDLRAGIAWPQGIRTQRGLTRMSAVFVLCWTSVNYQLSFIGLVINEKAQPQNVTTATTISEAQERASDLHLNLLSSVN